MDTETRRSCERKVVQAYYDELMILRRSRSCSKNTNYATNSVINNNNDANSSFTWEECWKEYKVGGIERWLWFLVYFCGQPLDSPLLKWAQFFHNQICAFLKDHKMKPTDFTQPRP